MGREDIELCSRERKRHAEGVSSFEPRNCLSSWRRAARSAAGSVLSPRARLSIPASAVRCGLLLALAHAVGCSAPDDLTEVLAPASSEPPPAAPLMPPTVPERLESIGIQLYTLRAEAEQDLEGTLERVAAMGYDEVEFDKLYGNDPRSLRTVLDALGLEAAANHVAWDQLRARPQESIDETVALGARYMVLAWMPASVRDTLDEWQEWVEVLNEVASQATKQGVRLAYHNHDFEFEPIDGVLPYDLLLEGLAPELVDLELDFYWLALGGGDALELFERAPGRFALSHLKDMATDRSMADVGQGVIDFARAFAAREQSGMRHFYVEHDDTADPWRTAQVSLDYLRALEF